LLEGDETDGRLDNIVMSVAVNCAKPSRKSPGIQQDIILARTAER
jgi:hypothetical protein